MHLEAWQIHGKWNVAAFIPLAFTCENDQKVFYKVMKDCLRFRIKKSFYDFR